LNNAPDELDILTPEHFLIGTPLPLRCRKILAHNHIAVANAAIILEALVDELRLPDVKWKTAMCNAEIEVERLIRDETLKWHMGKRFASCILVLMG